MGGDVETTDAACDLRWKVDRRTGLGFDSIILNNAAHQEKERNGRVCCSDGQQ